MALARPTASELREAGAWYDTKAEGLSREFYHAFDSVMNTVSTSTTMSTSTLSLQMTYRNGKAVAAYIGLGRVMGERCVRSEEVGPEIVVDFGADGRPLGIEVIDPISATAEEVYGVFDRLGLRRPSPGALSPLTAA